LVGLVPRWGVAGEGSGCGGEQERASRGIHFGLLRLTGVWVPEMLVTPVDLPVHPAHDPGFRAAIGAHTDDSEHLGVNVGLDPRARACAGEIVSAQPIDAR